MIENSKFSTPILFLVFNRPNETKFVFEHIRALRPDNLYVACDGPRYGNIEDVENIAKVKDIVESIDWDCNCKFLFRD